MTETTRIRWQPGAEAWATAWFGYVGTLDSHLFEILRPGRSDEWTLITTSGTPGIIADSRYGSDPDVLKAEAERWLEQFAAALGAVFPDALLALADRWQQFAAKDDAADECARELREAITGPGSAEDVVAASIEQQSAYRNELRHLPGYMTREEER